MYKCQINFKGDSTEDPEHPKIFWPSNVTCPACHTPGSQGDEDGSNVITIRGTVHFVVWL